MKLFRLFSVFALALVLMAGCSKDSDSSSPTNNNNTTSAGTLSMKVDGTFWEPKGEQGSYVDGEVLSGSNNITIKAVKYISAANLQYETLRIHIDSIGLGTFTFGSLSSAPHSAYFQRQTSASKIDIYQTLANGDGSVTITKCDKTNNLISGTFSFKGTIPASSPAKTVMLTEGTFTDVKWTVL